MIILIIQRTNEKDLNGFCDDKWVPTEMILIEWNKKDAVSTPCSRIKAGKIIN